jgi:hypothetical protein
MKHMSMNVIPIIIKQYNQYLIMKDFRIYLNSHTIFSSQKRYAEADPTDDVGGGDARSKLAILANLALGRGIGFSGEVLD